MTDKTKREKKIKELLEALLPPPDEIHEWQCAFILKSNDVSLLAPLLLDAVREEQKTGGRAYRELLTKFKEAIM